ncbi:MAG TPA: hypothetical protein VF771_12660 [Longimicrobiaceae bacterium]
MQLRSPARICVFVRIRSSPAQPLGSRCEPSPARIFVVVLISVSRGVVGAGQPLSSMRGPAPARMVVRMLIVSS